MSLRHSRKLNEIEERNAEQKSLAALLLFFSPPVVPFAAVCADVDKLTLAKGYVVVGS